MIKPDAGRGSGHAAGLVHFGMPVSTAAISQTLTLARSRPAGRSSTYCRHRPARLQTRQQEQGLIF
jgi:hypothetical protein